MPIRFRCSECDRLLGIARRKAGTQIRCPQCGELTTVPVEDAPDAGGHDRTLGDLDDLLGPAPATNGSLLASPEPALITIDASAAPKPPKPLSVEYSAPRPAAAPKPKRPAPKSGDSLFEQDVDALLGIERSEEAFVLDEPKAKPVTGMDAMSLDDGPGTITLSSQKATLIVVAAVILMLVAFVTGFAIRATI